MPGCAHDSGSSRPVGTVLGSGPIAGTGRVLHRGGSVAFLAGELRDDAGEVLATGPATARIIRPAGPGPAAVPEAGR